MKLEIMNARIIYHDKGYYTEIIEKKGYQEIWISNIDYGIKTLCYEFEKKDDEELIDIIEANIETYIDMYNNEVIKEDY